jgi:hypothetical protein
MLFDEMSEDEIETAATEGGGVLVVPARAETSDALNVMELEYRKHGRPPIVFIEDDDDGGDPIGNRDQLAAYLGRPAASLTIENVDELVHARWLATEGRA